jgi:hypothetical protein
MKQLLLNVADGWLAALLHIWGISIRIFGRRSAIPAEIYRVLSQYLQPE